MYLITPILIIIAAAFNAACDMDSNLFFDSIFSTKNPLYYDPSICWKNKYKNGDVKQGPKFFGSTTFLIFITDAWHLFKTIWMSCLFTSILFYKPILPSVFHYIDFFIFYIIWGITFEITKSKLTIK